MRTVRTIAGAVLLMGACQSEAAALREARASLAKVWPDVALDDVRIVGWDSALARGALTGAGGEAALSLPFARRLLDVHGPSLERLGVVPPGGIAALRAALLDEPEWVGAFVLPSAAAIVVRRRPVRDVHLLMHELGHHASFRRGHWQIAEQRMMLRGGELDAQWVDLDAYLSFWALEEGLAELSALVAQRGDAAIAAAAARVPEFGPDVLLVGPGTIRFGEQRHELAEGEQRYVAHSPAERVLQFAYEFGLHHAARALGATPLAVGATEVVRDFPATTAAVLQGAPGARRSELAAAFRERADELPAAPIAATRVGAFFVMQRLAQQLDVSTARERALALEDDLLLRWADGGLVWVTTWRDADSAAAFAAVAEAVPDARVQRRERHVLLALGATPDDAEQVLASWARLWTAP